MPHTASTRAEPDLRKQVLKAAENARLASVGKDYAWGGSTTDGFDCSGFVIYVLNKVFGAANPPRTTAENLRKCRLFVPGSEPALPGDLIFFSANGVTATHVGIVVSTDRWIGSQNSTGVAYVQMANKYWQPKILCYRRHGQLSGVASRLPIWRGMHAATLA